MNTGAPHRVLFACNLNSIRSPMAAGLLAGRTGGAVEVTSCGAFDGGYLDPFMVEVMDEVGVDMSAHQAQTFDALAGRTFDVIVALTPESYRQAQTFAADTDAVVENWPASDPTQELGKRDARLAAYRGVRDALADRIRERFPGVSTIGG